MNVTRTASAAFIVEFESEEELREEHRANLSMGGLRLATTETRRAQRDAARDAARPVGRRSVRARHGRRESSGCDRARDRRKPRRTSSRACWQNRADDSSEETPEKKQNIWDRIRALSQMEKLLLAVKADRTERALLLQDNDPRVLLSLLRNPRLTVDEVARLAKSSFLTYQIADVIIKTAQWMANLDVRLGLIHNPKTPPAFALRILPTLPEAEVRSIARAGTNMALKTAALRQLQGRSIRR